MVFCLITPAFSATYYACIAGNINAANAWEDAVGCDGTTYTITGAFPAAGDILEANGAAMTVNVDPGPNGKVHIKTTAGGGFAYATATNITLNTDITAGTTACLAITGSTGGGTILGNITGGSGSSTYGVNDSHTVVTVTYGASGSPITIAGGAGTNSHGVYMQGAGPSVVYANSTGNTGKGWNNAGNSTCTYTGNATAVSSSGVENGGASGVLTMTGNCTGSGTANASGCTGAGAAAFIITGNLISGARGSGASGNIVWTPAGPGTTADNYIKIQSPTAGNYIYVSESLPIASVEDGYTYGFDGATYYTGTLAGGSGGGAWGF